MNFLIQPSAGRAPISNPGMGEAGNFGGSNFIPANGLTVAQNQVNTGVAPDFARHRAVNCYFLNGAKYLTHFFLIKRFSLDRGTDHILDSLPLPALQVLDFRHAGTWAAVLPRGHKS